MAGVLPIPGLKFQIKFLSYPDVRPDFQFQAGQNLAYKRNAPLFLGPLARLALFSSVSSPVRGFFISLGWAMLWTWISFHFFTQVF